MFLFRVRWSALLLLVVLVVFFPRRVVNPSSLSRPLPLSSSLPTATVPVGSTDTSPGGGVTKKDIFGTGGTDSPAAFVPAGAWAETAEVAADLEGVGASKAVAHLVLRDGDQFFASENLPWARLVVNGEPVRIPHDVKHGDRVKLRVRAETAAEIEAWTSEDENASLGKRTTSDGSSSETENTHDWADTSVEVAEETPRADA